MKPTAAPRHFPFPEHRTMADVMAAEGISWNAAIAVRCPNCGASPHECCRFPNNTKYFALHLARRELAA